jgi:cell division protein FtsZ
LVFGLGGGTGSGGSLVLIETLMKMPNPPAIITVTASPFSFEITRKDMAIYVLSELYRMNNCGVVNIPLTVIKRSECKGKTINEAIEYIDGLFCRVISSLLEISHYKENVNLSLNSIFEVLSCKGSFYMSFGQASGKNRLRQAIGNAILNPVLSIDNLKGAKNILIDVNSGYFLDEEECESSKELLAYYAQKDSKINITWKNDPFLSESMGLKVTILASGFDTPKIVKKGNIC